MDQSPSILDQQYQTDIHRIWHLSTPPPELLAALEDGWLGVPRRVLDLGCGLGSELAHLAQRGVALTVGVDRSMAALQRARRLHPAVAFVQADVLELPFAPAGFEVVLDRGCWHYLRAADRPRYAAEVWRVLCPGGRFLLRACLYAQGSATTLPSRSFGGALLAGASSASCRPRFPVTPGRWWPW
jgi:SAM-dependent methyltransferase